MPLRGSCANAPGRPDSSVAPHGAERITRPLLARAVRGPACAEEARDTNGVQAEGPRANDPPPGDSGMDPFATSHFSDDALIHDAKRLLGQGFMTNAMLLTRITEIDRRQLYRREGHPSMYSYMVEGWHLTEDAAYKRIHAARVAQRFPAVLIALAEGRLHMRGVLMLATHITSANADELVAAATHKNRFQIQQVLAARFPRPDLPERLPPFAPTPPATAALSPSRGTEGQLAPEQVPVTIPEQSAHGQAFAPPPEPTPERFGLQLTLDQETYDLLEEARALTGHRNRTGEILPVLKGALMCYVGQLRKQKFAATTRPRPSKPGASPRHIPASVKRAVWERNGGRCTFVSESGQRCPARSRLEFDHIEPVARGRSEERRVGKECRSRWS